MYRLQSASCDQGLQYMIDAEIISIATKQSKNEK
jgi:hypothetical protein